MLQPRVHFLSLLLFSYFSFIGMQASASYLKIGGNGGFGSFSANREGKSKSEGPLSFSITLDYDINSRWSLGAEHLRSFSLSPVGTSVAMTGFVGRYYYLGPVPNSVDFDAPYLRARLTQVGMYPFVGWSVGFAQASIIGTDSSSNILALSLAAALKTGFDYPFLGNWAFRNELNIGIPLAGTGTVTYFSLMAGGVYFW